ncbi:N-anthranilate isomerase [Multifurca ochricompacta]|uniref:Multifunctional tryptophan biosynthesis protein n=1 Tax=Multifurca ochricompacta TaxID=376703 RepID=A0AAD4M5S4_9AGAM|nr:N-anthranilate isomerase [Multifurca ochricompacta]
MSLPEHLARPLDVLMIDNFDSFTWNLYQHLTLLGADVTVIRNSAITSDDLPLLHIRALIISPGPGHPITDSGISRDAIRHFTGRVPVLGVCMGLECLVDVFGGEISYAGEIMHGKLSPITHDGRGCFRGLPQGFKSTRYHSLSANINTLPPELAITASSQDSGVIMGVRHRVYTLEAVQYHPESILSEFGDHLFRNFLELNGGLWKENLTARVLDQSLPPFAIDTPDDKPTASDQKNIPSLLEKIYAQRLKDVEVAKATPGTTPADLATFLAMHLAPPSIPLVARLKAKTPALMAEIKRASPSKGPIALSANAAQQALTYALSGASVISVLTEPTWFKGSLLDLRLARQAVDALPNRPALLRKDFILDEYQIAEGRLHGADTVLLIVAMLPPVRLHELYHYSLSLGMEPLVEVNNAHEMEAALTLGARVIGVNNRNLHNFQVDMGTTSRLADMVKGQDVLLCALSGITGREDVRQYVQQGVSAVLVGEALMKATDTRAFISELLDWPKNPDSEVLWPPLVKICGIRTTEEALLSANAGAAMLGLMLVPTSKRSISLEQAQAISSAIRGLRASTKPSAPPPLSSHGTHNEPWFTLHARRLFQSAARPLVVGVFQDQPLSYILHCVTVVQLDVVQLHGSEPLEWTKQIPVPVIRVFHVDADGRGLDGIARPGLHQHVLLDTAVSPGALSGGSGKTFDWELARRVVLAGESEGSGGMSSPFPIVLAGGLTVDNVAQAVTVVRPWAVDVSGGVETPDGLGKDVDKVKGFIEAVQQCKLSL